MSCEGAHRIKKDAIDSNVGRLEDVAMGQKIGFIGLGVMGKPMSRNLIKAGYELTVCKHVAEGPVKELESAGAKVAFSPKEVARRNDVVITMVPDSPDVENVTLGPSGIFEEMRPGSTYIDMSTISLVSTKRFAEAAGSEYGVPLPVTSLIHEMMGAMNVSGLGEHDHSAIITVLEDLAKVQVKKPAPT